MTAHQTLLLRIASITWSCCVGCLATFAAEADIERAFQKVAGMNAIERDRIERNFENYEALPEERRQHLRQLNNELQADTKSGGDLHAIMETYSMWLKTLTPGQRDDLRRETDALKKMQLVKKFKEEQDARNEAQAMYVGSWNERRNRSASRGPALSSQDLQGLIEICFKDLPVDLQRDAQTQTGLSRSRRILESSFRQAGGRLRWPAEPQLVRLIDAIQDPELKKQLESKKGPDQRISFLSMFYRGLGNLVGAEIERNLPAEQDLQTFFSEMDSTRRDELMRLPPDDARKRLTYLFIQEKSPELRALFEMRRDLGFPFGGFGPGGGPGGMGNGGPPGNGPPGDRPPGERNTSERNSGERGPGQRPPRNDGPAK